LREKSYTTYLTPCEELQGSKYSILKVILSIKYMKSKIAKGEINPRPLFRKSLFYSFLFYFKVLWHNQEAYIISYSRCILSQTILPRKFFPRPILPKSNSFRRQFFPMKILAEDNFFPKTILLRTVLLRTFLPGEILPRTILL
jgi:hypothetical protein